MGTPAIKEKEERITSKERCGIIIKRILNGETLIKLLITNMDTMRTSTPTEDNKVQMS